MREFILLAVVSTALLASGAGAAPDEFVLVDAGSASPIVVAPGASDTEVFAAEEIARYVERMTGAKLPVRRTAQAPRGSVVLSVGADKTLSDEQYSLYIRDDRLHLTGARPRALLYAAYDLLERLGCRWLSPEFDYYGADAEVVPKTGRLLLRLDAPVVEAPRLKLRKLYVEEGLSHNQRNLAQMIDWMAKSRFNTLVIPIDYQGSGRVKWDNWREALTPELRKRDITIEVGGHGYQNFLNAGMEDGKLFEVHPEWFAMDASGKRRQERNFVPCTSNPEAVAYLAKNVVAYLQSHPEIDIFDFWPPDGCKWCECAECAKLGTPQDRQSILIAQVATEAKKQGIDARFECIAYSMYTLPPSNPRLDPAVLVDFCPINQCFEAQIDDPGSERNAGYASALAEWRKGFGGDVSIYSYYRKYAWRSLPVIIPHYVQKDLQWYRRIGVAGVSSYAEPGDWRTYELNHYVLARLAWNADAPVDAILSDFCVARFGSAAGAARSVYQALEETVRFASSIPFTALKTPEEIDRHAARLRSARQAFEGQAHDTNAGKALLAAVDYALSDFALRKHRAEDGPVAERNEMIRDLHDFIQKHAGEGVFLSERIRLETLAKTHGAAE